MYKFGIIGYPLGHSLSAVIQKSAFESMNIDATYEVLETPPENLIDRIKFLKRNDFNGFNVTIPLKVPVSLFVNEIDDDANIAGCVNTVKVGEDKSFYGFNTDIYSFKRAIPDEIDLSEYVNFEFKDVIFDAINKVGTERLKPIKEILPDNISEIGELTYSIEFFHNILFST